MGGDPVALPFESMRKTKRASCPGSAGEVIQGIVGGRETLVSLTINRFSEMEVFFGDPSSIPAELWKSRRALELALEHLGVECLKERVTFRRRRSLPEGKGFASSTADIAALLGALAGFLGKRIRGEEIARLALQIEPTDGTLFPEWCLFDHLQGEVFLSLPVPRNLGVVVVEPKRKVDTLSIDRAELHRHFEVFARETERAFEMLEKGLEEGDLSLVGKAATVSALLMQEYEHDEIFSTLFGALNDVRALGVSRAHTGSAFGVLFDLRLVNLEEARRRVSGVLKNHEVNLWTARAIGGGVRVMEG